MKPQLVWIFCYLMCWDFGYLFNIDTHFPIIYSKPPETYFGFSVLLHYNQNNKWQLLVGAPRADQSFSRGTHRPGALYQCSLERGFCDEVLVETSERRYDHKANQWLGVNLDENSDGTVVTCAHRWKNQAYYQIWKNNEKRDYNKIQDYYSTGVCYTIPVDLKANTAKRHTPLSSTKHQVTNEIPDYCFGMAGMSSHFVEDGKLLLGAPGVYSWEGKLVTINNLKDNDLRSVVWAPERKNETKTNFMYLGYSVTSGRFNADTASISYVVGAPRYMYFGKVYIVKPSNPQYKIEFSWQGEQFGEYFGAAVCAIDLNQDGYDDLIVGSPLHAIIKDEGKVSVYMNNLGKGFLDLPQKLDGSKSIGARFGTTIVALGDINLDAFPDFAVGAPYEDENGVVYVYFGDSQTGISSDLTQKLEAKKINPFLKGFGMSIAKGKDVDRNSYLDIAVGSYESGNAVVLRSQPPVILYGTIFTSPKKLAINSFPCRFNGQDVGCLNVTACISFKTPRVMNEVNVLTELNFDTIMDPRSKRGFWYDPNSFQSVTVMKQEKLKNRHDQCTTYQAFLKPKIRNYLTPIAIAYNFKLHTPQTDQFCATCPVLSPKSENSIVHEVHFQIGCGNDELCHSDLHLQVAVVNQKRIPIVNPMIWTGSNKTIMFEVSVSNSLEAAYTTELNVTTPEWSQFVNLPTTTSCIDHRLSHHLRSLICDIGNPLLEKAGKTSLLLYLNIEFLPSDFKELRIDFKVTTGSNETEELLHDNDVVVTIPTAMSADITVYGSTVDEYVIHTNVVQNGTSIFPFTHVYEVVNLGPSALDHVQLTIDVPEMSRDGSLKFIKNITIQTRDGPHTASVTSCLGADSSSYLTTEGKSKYDDLISGPDAVKRKKRALKDPKSTTKNAQLFCHKVKCRKIKCDLVKFAPDDSVKLQLQLELDIKILEKLELSEDIIDYTTEAKATILNAISNIQPPNHEPDSAKVITSFDTGRTSTQELPPWVIPVSIILGVLLLLALAALFYKLGFFDRTQRDALKKAQQADNTDAAEMPENPNTFDSKNNLLEPE